MESEPCDLWNVVVRALFRRAGFLLLGTSLSASTRAAPCSRRSTSRIWISPPVGRGFIAFLSALAEDERQRIVKRANDGRKAARARGARFGRKPKLNEHQRKEAIRRLAAGESARAVARMFAVHHATVSRLRASA